MKTLLLLLAIFCAININAQVTCNYNAPALEWPDSPPWITAGLTLSIFPAVNHYSNHYNPSPEQWAVFAASCMVFTSGVFIVEHHIRKQIKRNKFKHKHR